MMKQAGFTLIELMLALALGLVISAAAIFLFLTAQKSYSVQQGLSNVQDNANFGLNYLTKDLRLANLNNTQSIINSTTAYGGIVLTSSVNAQQDTTVTPAIPLSNLFRTITGSTANVNLLSRSAGATAGTAPAWTGASNVQSGGADLSSDQLVMQYTPQYVLDKKGTPSEADDTIHGGFDCEGRELVFPLQDQGDGSPFGAQVIVQRYFLREDTNKGTEPNKALSLACDAGSYSHTPNPTAIRNYGDAGEIIMSRVEHFHVLLTTQNANSTFRYVSLNDYLTLADPKPRIVAVQIGILSRSTQAVGSESTIKDDQEFQVLDQTVTVKKDANIKTKYVRQVVTQTIALRNAVAER